jgi:hypothetical protein
VSTWAVANIREAVLRVLGVLGQGQAASPEDTTIVDDAISSAHNELRKLSKAPFETTAVPNWAQPGLKYFVASRCCDEFGQPERFMELERRGLRLLGDQISRRSPRKRPRVVSY